MLVKIESETCEACGCILSVRPYNGHLVCTVLDCELKGVEVPPSVKTFGGENLKDLHQAESIPTETSKRLDENR